MQDEKKSKKVDFETQMKTMKAAVKESERKAEEEEKKRKEEEKEREFAEQNVRDAIRKVEALNWRNTILDKKVKSVAKELTKKLDMAVALQKTEASAWANHKKGMILVQRLKNNQEKLVFDLRNSKRSTHELAQQLLTKHE